MSEEIVPNNWAIDRAGYYLSCLLVLAKEHPELREEIDEMLYKLTAEEMS